MSAGLLGGILVLVFNCEQATFIPALPLPSPDEPLGLFCERLQLKPLPLVTMVMPADAMVSRGLEGLDLTTLDSSKK